MADRVEAFAATIPAGTTKAAPTVVPLTFDPGYLARIEVVIPNGVAGLAGFRVAYGGQQLIPNTPGAWIVGNDERWSDEPDFAMVGQQWQLVGYNLDHYAHTFYVRCYVREIGKAAGAGDAVPTVLPLAITADIPLDITADTLGGFGAGEPPPLPADDTLTPLDLGPDQVSVPALDLGSPDTTTPDAPPAVDPAVDTTPPDDDT